MQKLNIYCGWYRETIVRKVSKIVKDIAFEFPCIECDGTGIWDYSPEDTVCQCVACKGTGKQYVGL